MTEPLTLDDVLAWLALRTAYDVPPDMVDCLPTADPQHFIEYAGKGNVLLLGPYAGTALETGDIRTVLETAKERGLLPKPKREPRRWDTVPTPPADVILSWCKALNDDTDLGSIEEGHVISVGVLRDEDGFPAWAVILRREVSSAITFRVCDILNRPHEPWLVLAGYVKWDGCVNLSSNGDMGGDHFCGPDDESGGLARFSRMLRAVYALAWGVFRDKPLFEKPHVADLEVVLAPPARKEET